jgi:hypothetical protein
MQHTNSFRSPELDKNNSFHNSKAASGFECGLDISEQLQMRIDPESSTEPLKVNQNILNVPACSIRDMKMNILPFKSPIKADNSYCPYS